MEMLRHISCCLLLAFLLSLAGCAPVEISADYFQKGFDYQNLGYTALPESSPFHKTMVIKDIRIILVGREDQYQQRRIAYHNDSTAQPMEPRHEIWVIGKKLKGKIILNQVVLGNELKHLMHMSDPEVACPYRMEAIEACVAVHPPDQCNKLEP